MSRYSSTTDTRASVFALDPTANTHEPRTPRPTRFVLYHDRHSTIAPISYELPLPTHVSDQRLERLLCGRVPIPINVLVIPQYHVTRADRPWIVERHDGLLMEGRALRLFAEGFEGCYEAVLGEIVDRRDGEVIFAVRHRPNGVPKYLSVPAAQSIALTFPDPNWPRLEDQHPPRHSWTLHLARPRDRTRQATSTSIYAPRRAPSEPHHPSPLQRIFYEPPWVLAGLEEEER